MEKQEIKYFLFSKEQMDVRKEVESKINRIYIPGEIIIKGKKHMFTEISDNINSRFKDTVVVAKVEDIKLARYRNPRVVSRV